MGMFDTVLVDCPECGKEYGFQSKSGECLMRTYTLSNCPADVMMNVNRHAPVKCGKCGTEFYVGFNIEPARVKCAAAIKVTKEPRDHITWPCENCGAEPEEQPTPNKGLWYVYHSEDCPKFDGDHPEIRREEDE